MITDEMVARINYLAKKSKTEEGLTEGEKLEQAELRAIYIKAWKKNLESQLDNTYILDENGNKRKVQKKKK